MPAGSPRSALALQLSLLIGLAVWLACSESAPESGMYRLRRLNQTAVPYDDTLGCCIYTGGYLRLADADYDVRIFFQNRNNLIIDTVFEVGSYRLFGDSLAFTPRSGNFPLSLYGAVRQGDTISLWLGGDGPGASDQFRADFSR